MIGSGLALRINRPSPPPKVVLRGPFPLRIECEACTQRMAALDEEVEAELTDALTCISTGEKDVNDADEDGSTTLHLAARSAMMKSSSSCSMPEPMFISWMPTAPRR